MRSYRYLALCAWKSALGRSRSCPSCGRPAGEVIDRKYLVTALRRCRECLLLYRTPTTTAEENARFYQSDYEESTTTDLPDAARLDQLKAEDFASLSTSYLGCIEVIRGFGARAGQSVMDFGCSWGYGSHQLKQAGFEVQSFEISQPRADYARQHLAVETLALDAIPSAAYDVFLSCHVIEHVPSVEEMFMLGERALKPGGLFVAFTPNGSMERRRRDPEGWHRNWGGVHPQMIDDQFLMHAGSRRTFVAASNPYPLEALGVWNGSQTVYSMEGDELMLAFRKPLI